MKHLLLRNRKFVLYCVIGVSGMTLDFVIFSLLVRSNVLEIQAANAAGYASGTLLSFILNARYNFKTRDWMAVRMLSFFAVAGLGFAVSAATIGVLAGRFAMNKYAAKLVTIGVVVALQYNLNRLISFRKSSAE